MQGKDLSRQAAAVIFPTDRPAEEDAATRAMYTRSHQDFQPGEGGEARGEGRGEGEGGKGGTGEGGVADTSPKGR